MSHLCHKEVRRVAKEMAGAAYEELAKNDAFYKIWPNQNLFIAKRWALFLQIARDTLVYMLGQEHYSDAMRADLYDVIIKDRELQMVQSMPASELVKLPMAGSA